MSEIETDCELQAYVDGELDAAAAHKVEQRLSSDPKARGQVKLLRHDAALLRAALQGPVNEDPPQQLVDVIDRGFASYGRSKTASRWPPALAAALIMAMIGGVVGYLVGDYRVRAGLQAAAAQEVEEERLLSAAITRALEQTASGSKLAWNSPTTGAHGDVTPVRTYRSKSNHWCREYFAVKVADGDEETRRAIACRETDGSWTTAEELFHNS